jgi:hypothetical protein
VDCGSDPTTDELLGELNELADALAVGIIGSMFSNTLADWKRKHQQYCAQLISDITAETQSLPFGLMVQGNEQDLPVYRRAPKPPVSLFPLGECRTTWLGGTRGHTVLYLGDDYQLYEYGPFNLHVEVLSIRRNEIALRPLPFEALKGLDAGDLMMIRDNLRAVWI